MVPSSLKTSRPFGRTSKNFSEIKVDPTIPWLLIWKTPWYPDYTFWNHPTSYQHKADIFVLGDSDTSIENLRPYTKPLFSKLDTNNVTCATSSTSTSGTPISLPSADYPLNLSVFPYSFQDLTSSFQSKSHPSGDLFVSPSIESNIWPCTDLLHARIILPSKFST